MSEKNKPMAGLGPLLCSLLLGAGAAAGCTAGMAALMASQMLPPSTAWPLATAAVSAGSLFSGWLAAAWYGRRGLVYGIAEGGLFALCLLILQLTKGIVPDPLQASRLGLVVFLGCAGGSTWDAAGTAPSSQGKFTLNRSRAEAVGKSSPLS